MTVEELEEFIRVTQRRSEQLEAIMIQLHNVTITQSELLRQHQSRIDMLEAMLYPIDKSKVVN